MPNGAPHRIGFLVQGAGKRRDGNVRARRAGRLVSATVAWLAGTLAAAPAAGQLLLTPIAGEQAAAAQQMIVVAVQQAISSLPPSAGQAFSYSYDPEADTFVKTNRLGPTALRSTDPIRKGQFDVRFAASYFALDQSFEPIDYQITGLPEPAFTRLGLDADADVTVLSLAASYGVTSRVEVRGSLPIVVTDARVRTRYLVAVEDPELLGVAPSPQILDAWVCPMPDCLLAYQDASFASLGVAFPGEGTNAGVGRISLGAKALAYKGKWAEVGFESDLYFPSPNEEELAGSDTFSILPRALAAVPATPWLRFHVDAGYDYDFSEAVLRRFVWNAGFSASTERFGADLGVGGSEYDAAIEWTPDSAPLSGLPGVAIEKLPGEDNRLGTSLIDVLIGLKARLSDTFVLSGAVVVPVDGGDFRPAAIGSLAIEAYF